VCQLKEDDAMRGTVIQVGDGGRGFIIETEEARYVVTAAHCLSEPPPPHTASHRHERTCADLLGALDGPRNVWAECAFYDPVADLAVFCEPDSQVLAGAAEAFGTLTDNATPFTIGRLRFHRPRRRLQDGTVISLPRRAVGDALMLSLDGEWFSCRIRSGGHALWIEDAAQPIRPPFGVPRVSATPPRRSRLGERRGVQPLTDLGAINP
jgi:hypothetical protein